MPALTSEFIDRRSRSHSAVPPTRHGADLPTTRAMASRLKLAIAGPCEPDEVSWNKLGAALWRGDPLADEVALWLHQEGMAVARPQLERAIEGGGCPGDAPVALRRLMEAVQAAPAWLDRSLMAQGARFLQSTGLHGMRVLRDAGLMAGYQASAINQTLLMTGSLKKGAQRRVAETTSWWLDCTKDGGMDRSGAGFKATVRVRVMHALVRQSVSQRPQWNAAAWGLPINQVDMQATYLAFSVVQLLALKTTGCLVTSEDARAVMHLWRYIGWLMGVEEGLLCDDELKGRVLLYHNVISQAPPDESSAALGQALMDEPLARHYPWAPKLLGPYNKARHLSQVSWFVGPQGMKHLGLPATLPWYPVLTAGPRFIITGLTRLVAGGVDGSAAWGRRRQERYWRQELGAGEHGHCPRL